MFRVDTNTACVSLPNPAATGTPGYFRAADPSKGQAATIPGADWFNNVQEELLAPILAAGLVPDKNNRSQLLSAILVLMANNPIWNTIVHRADDETITGKKTMSGGITGLPAPSASTDAARKAEIDTLNTLITTISGQSPFATAAAGQASALAVGAVFYVVPSTHGGVTDIYTKGASTPAYVGAVPSVAALSALGSQDGPGNWTLARLFRAGNFSVAPFETIDAVLLRSAGVVLDPDGRVAGYSNRPEYEPYMYGKQFLRQSRLKMRQIVNETAGAQLKQTLIADSYGGDNCILYSYYRHMVAKWGSAGAGFQALMWSGGGGGPWVIGGAQPTNHNQSPAASLGQVSSPRYRGAWSCSYNTPSENGPALAYAKSSTAGDRVEIDILLDVSDQAALLYYGTGNGVVKVSYDGGATWSANIPLNQAGPHSVVLSAVPAGARTFVIEVVSGNVWLAGPLFKHSTNRGFRLDVFSAGGSVAATHWSKVNQLAWSRFLADVDPDVIAIHLGINDKLNSVDPAVTKFAIGAVLSNCRSVRPYCDYALISAAEVNLVTAVEMKWITAKVRELAIERGCAHLIMQDLLGSPDAHGADYAAGSTHPWMRDDGVHLQYGSGGYLEADAWIELFDNAWAERIVV